METFEKIKEDIISLNKRKNNYASKKIKGEISEKEEKELISRIISLISEVRKIASLNGILDNGKIEKTITPEFENIFKNINNCVTELKKQIVIIIENSPSKLLELMKMNKKVKLESINEN